MIMSCWEEGGVGWGRVGYEYDRGGSEALSGLDRVDEKESDRYLGTHVSDD